MHRLFEPLELRKLMSVSYGTNLVVNPGAEQFTGVANGTNVVTLTGWSVVGDPTAVPYGDSNFLATAPAGAGSYFFSGGPDSQGTDIVQTIDLSSIGSAIDAGQVSFNVSALVGGHGSEDDSATVFVNYQSMAVGGFLGQTFIVPPFAADRGNVSELIPSTRTATFPKGTRFAELQVHFDRRVGTTNDGYADNISLVVSKQAANTGTITGRVFNDKNGDTKLNGKDKGLASVTVYAIDSTGKKTKARTNSKGTYILTLAPGTYTIRQVLPAGFKQVAAPKKFTISQGTPLASRNFADHSK